MKKLFSFLLITFTILAANICHGADKQLSKNQPTNSTGFSQLKMLQADNKRLAKEAEIWKALAATPAPTVQVEKKDAASHLEKENIELQRKNAKLRTKIVNLNQAQKALGEALVQAIATAHEKETMLQETAAIVQGFMKGGRATAIEELRKVKNLHASLNQPKSQGPAS